MVKRASGIVLHWLPLGITILLLGGLVIATTQQVYRTGLNDPQLRLVGDAVELLESGKELSTVVATSSFDAARSLAPFTAAYDAEGNPLAWNATVNGEAPRPPQEVFTRAKERGEKRFTWHPEENTRLAVVIRPVTKDGRFVAVGRNMSEIEGRIWSMTRINLASIFLIMLISLVLEGFGDWWRRRAIPTA